MFSSSLLIGKFGKIHDKEVIILLLIMIAFLSPFVSRYFPLFDKVGIFLFLGLTILLLFGLDKKIRISYFISWIIFITFIIYLLEGLGLYYLMEFFIWFSFFGFVFVDRDILIKFHKRFLYFLIVFSALQLLFDIAFPVLTANTILDRYTGTFVMPNNKSRYLSYVLTFLLVAPLPINKQFKMICIVSIGISLILGHSTFGLLFAGISILAGKYIKNFFVFLAVVIIGFGVTFSYISNNYQNNEFFLLTYNRYLDKDHGVYSIYLYGYHQLEKTYFCGVGFGNFASRAGQFIGSPITRGIPETMINYNKDLFATKTPYGLSSLFIIFVELGIFAIPLIWFIFKKLWYFKHNSFWGYFSFYFLFFIIIYSPTFFEFSEGSLYIITFLITNTYLKVKDNERSSFRLFKQTCLVRT